MIALSNRLALSDALYYGTSRFAPAIVAPVAQPAIVAAERPPLEQPALDPATADTGCGGCGHMTAPDVPASPGSPATAPPTAPAASRGVAVLVGIGLVGAFLVVVAVVLATNNPRARR